jgi:hypothetical protein
VAALEILYEQVASEAPPPEQNIFPGAVAANSIGALQLGEGMTSTLLDGFDFLDFQDMSWLNSVPSHLY